MLNYIILSLNNNKTPEKPKLRTIPEPIFTI